MQTHRYASQHKGQNIMNLTSPEADLIFQLCATNAEILGIPRLAKGISIGRDWEPIRP